MLLGRIIGTVVATRKDPRLEGKKLLVCRPIDPDGKDEKGYIVAVDTSMPAFESKSSSFKEVRLGWRPAVKTRPWMRRSSGSWIRSRRIEVCIWGKSSAV